MPSLIESVATVNTLVEGIRDDALTLRMVPINEIFNRFPRLVHELSQQTGKTISLHINNADTDIDKSMVEKLTDPLMHLVRNAVDHGIEDEQQRLLAGKSASGVITLNAYHDAGAVVVEVSDDGRGIDREEDPGQGAGPRHDTRGQGIGGAGDIPVSVSARLLHGRPMSATSPAAGSGWMWSNAIWSRCAVKPPSKAVWGWEPPSTSDCR